MNKINKGIFNIPLNPQNAPSSDVLNEAIESVVLADKFGVDEAYFGEHITDKHEKIASSLMMVSALSKLTKKIKLGTLTVNLNFYNPAIASSLISMNDNLSKGRLILGIGSGANQTDIEAVGQLGENVYEKMLQNHKIIINLLTSKKDLSKNFTKKTRVKKLGLGYFNKLYKDRKNLETIMPALGPNSHNVKVCAKKKWSIVISNFCSDEIIDNHINNYLKYSPLTKKKALKKIKLSKFIFVTKNDETAKKLIFAKNSPYLSSVKIIYDKLKFFKRESCFGNNIKNPTDALNNIAWYGSEKTISKKINNFKKKYGSISSLIYVNIPKAKNTIYNESFEIFSKKIKC
tara:strand:- start:3253 stop:4290 length:1038 start_codon:yes stop_codon:yes gene_type:complete